MFRSAITRNLLSSPPNLRSTIIHQISRASTLSPSYAYSTSSPGVQSVTQVDFWKGLIPKPFRKDPNAPNSAKKPKSKEWNPATFYIWAFLLIGSMSIQMIALRNEFATFSRRADAKIGLLREVIERVHKGEDVDVEGLLGTGNAQKEQEWEEVMREIEQEEEFFKTSQRKKASDPKPETNQDASKPAFAEQRKPEMTKSKAPPGFY